ncbi:unnamed protein product, partial [Dibothriocephalus latus]
MRLASTGDFHATFALFVRGFALYFDREVLMTEVFDPEETPSHIASGPLRLEVKAMYSGNEAMEIFNKPPLIPHLTGFDYLFSTAFARAKPKHDWCAVLHRGFLRSAFPILYLDYWKRHLSPRLAAYLIFHFFIQLLQVSCFLVVNPLKTHVTEADVMVPLIMGLCLGILHSQITSAHGSHGSISATGLSAATVGATDVILAN